MKLDPDAIPRGDQTLDPNGYTPPLIAIKSNRSSWQSFEAIEEFQQSIYREMFDERDFVFGILWKMGHQPISVCEFEHPDQLAIHLVNTLHSVNKPWGPVKVFPRNWTGQDIMAFIAMQSGTRLNVAAHLQLSSEFCLTEEYRHLYPR